MDVRLSTWINPTDERQGANMDIDSPTAHLMKLLDEKAARDAKKKSKSTSVTAEETTPIAEDTDMGTSDDERDKGMTLRTRIAEDSRKERSRKESTDEPATSRGRSQQKTMDATDRSRSVSKKTSNNTRERSRSNTRDRSETMGKQRENNEGDQDMSTNTLTARLEGGNTSQQGTRGGSDGNRGKRDDNRGRQGDTRRREQRQPERERWPQGRKRERRLQGREQHSKESDYNKGRL